jgi:tetratricopeptide (TPR) repeat protein
MNFIRKNFYLLSFLVFAAFIVTIVSFREKEPSFPPLKNRVGQSAEGAEWLNTKQTIDGLIGNVESNPDDLKSKIRLAQAYIQEGRVTGDYNYYDVAALKVLEDVLKKEPNDFEALCAEATIYLNQHHFQQGLEVGMKTQKLYPHASFVYGILTDANVELGRYDDAVIAVDSMCSIRPDLRSYSRISYVREIFGDLDGAKAAMKMAANSGVPGLEQTEWCRVYLGKLYEQTGNIDTAEMIYQTSNTVRPNYAYALAGLGRVERAKKNYTESIKYFEQANALLKDDPFGEDLIELYLATGDKAKAESLSKDVIKNLQENSNVNDKNGDAGHYSDKELAYVYLMMNDNDNALKHAKLEYDRRPDNIDVNELMAWVHYKRGEYADAVPFADKSLRTGSKNPELVCRAGLVYCQNHQTEKGSMMISQAVSMNPFLHQDLLAEAKPFMPAQVSTVKN